MMLAQQLAVRRPATMKCRLQVLLVAPRGWTTLWQRQMLTASSDKLHPSTVETSVAVTLGLFLKQRGTACHGGSCRADCGDFVVVDLWLLFFHELCCECGRGL
jgi:hypothetical protein